MPQPPRVGAFPRQWLAAAKKVYRAPVAAGTMAPHRAPFIIGGTSATQGSYGYMATVIYYDSSGNPQDLCSGTLVSSNVVLTAGHCGADETTGVPNVASQYRVITNAVDWTDTTDRLVSGASQVVVDPNFSPTTRFGYGDAAMLVLSSPVNDPTIPLWASGQFLAGTDAVIAGWGRTYATQSTWTTTLEWAPTVLQNTTYCATNAPSNYSYDSSSELCAVNYPYDDTGICPGDSGGPLLARDSQGVWIEIGISSVGPTDCNTNTADFFTAVLPIESWIEAEISAAAPPPPPPPVTTTTTTTAPTPTTATTPTTPAPTTTTPAAKPTLPWLPEWTARSFVRRVLTGVFHRRYTAGHRKRLSCSRISRTRFNCGASFWFGPDDYYGNVIVYYESDDNNKLLWTDHYRLHWVNDHCYFHTSHRRTCKIDTRRGAW